MRFNVRTTLATAMLGAVALTASQEAYAVSNGCTKIMGGDWNFFITDHAARRDSFSKNDLLTFNFYAPFAACDVNTDQCEYLFGGTLGRWKGTGPGTFTFRVRKTGIGTLDLTLKNGTAGNYAVATRCTPATP